MSTNRAAQAQRSAAPSPAQDEVGEYRFVTWLEQQAPAEDLESKGGRTRLALKVAAARLLEEYGLEQQSIGMVADAAGVTRTNFYRYFNRMHDLMLEITQDYQVFLQRCLWLPTRPPSPEDVVREVNRRYVRVYATNIRLAMSMQEFRRTLPNDHPLQIDMNYTAAQRIASSILKQSGRRAGPQAKARALAAGYALGAMVDGLLGEMYVRRNPHLVQLSMSEESIADLLSDLWNAAVRQLASS